MEAGEKWLVDYDAVGRSSISTSGGTYTSMRAEMEAHIFPQIRNAGNEVQDFIRTRRGLERKMVRKGRRGEIRRAEIR